MSDHIVHVDDEQFEQEVLKSDKPVLVDYWAEWCGPCKMIEPLVSEIADEFGERLKVAKMDIESAPATPVKYGVRGIPTLMIFKNGQVEETHVGALTKGQLQQFVEKALG